MTGNDSLDVNMWRIIPTLAFGIQIFKTLPYLLFCCRAVWPWGVGWESNFNAKLAINNFSINLWNTMYLHHRRSWNSAWAHVTRHKVALSYYIPFYNLMMQRTSSKQTRSLIRLHKQECCLQNMHISTISVIHPNSHSQQLWLSTKQLFLSPCWNSRWDIIIVEHIFIHQLLNDASLYRRAS